MGVRVELEDGSTVDTDGWRRVSSGKDVVGGVDLHLSVDRHPDGRYLIRGARQEPKQKRKSNNSVAKGESAAAAEINRVARELGLTHNRTDDALAKLARPI
jgi:hypothetical protein